MVKMLREIFDNLDRHCGKFTHYFDIYEQHFNKFVGKKPVVVEVGICRGGSAEMWQKYFGEGATIVGIDIDPNSFKPEIQTPGCIQVNGNQGDPAFWDEFLKEYPQIDILIDDGSHHCSHQITTLQKVWPHITQGGVYLCEDTHTNYWPEYGGGMTNHTTFLNYSKLITDTMNREYYRGQDLHPNNTIFADYYKEVVGMHYYDSIVVLDKNQRQETKLITSTPI
jgi:23S rRNA U2552 (ribose-2'-O)-methylase RlmE/FtsJ